jgi:hypothetical protein
VTLPCVSGKSLSGPSFGLQSIDPVGVFDMNLDTVTSIEDGMPAMQEAMIAEEMSDVVWLTPSTYKSESARATAVVAVVACKVVGEAFAGTVVEPGGVSVVVVGRYVVVVSAPGRGEA